MCNLRLVALLRLALQPSHGLGQANVADERVDERGHPRRESHGRGVINVRGSFVGRIGADQPETIVLVAVVGLRFV